MEKNRIKLNLRNSMDLSVNNGNSVIKNIKHKLIKDNLSNKKKSKNKRELKTHLNLKMNGSMYNSYFAQNNYDPNDMAIKQINQKLSSVLNINKTKLNLNFLENRQNTNDSSINNSNFDIYKHVNSFSSSFQRNTSRKNSTKSNMNSNKNSFTRKASRSSSFRNPGSNKNINKVKILMINSKYLNILHGKEKAFYLLAHSPVLRLCERIIFARSSNNLRAMITIKELLKNNSIFLEDTINELKNKLKVCIENVSVKFKASKISEITLNFLISSEEEEFKKFYFSNEKEGLKKDFYSYLKILFLLFNENADDIEDKYLKSKLYEKIRTKGYNSIKDYLYQLYIKNKEENHILENIDAINEILEQNPKILKFNYFLKFNRFISFTTYIINEIITYANDMKNNMVLKIETQKLLGVVQAKLENYKIEYSKK